MSTSYAYVVLMNNVGTVLVSRAIMYVHKGVCQPKKKHAHAIYTLARSEF